MTTGSLLRSFFLTKPIDQNPDTPLKRDLNAWSLIELGIGAIIGAGLFVRTADAIANCAGGSVWIAFIVAGIGSALAGVCYAEFSSVLPSGGSAYEYCYVTMGELIAWVIGWDLILEYAVGAATVAISWSQYLNKLLEFIRPGLHLSYRWSHSPFETQMLTGVRGIVNIPAVGILLVLSLLLIRGTKESKLVNRLIVVTKVAIVVLVTVVGWEFIKPENHYPAIPAPVPFTQTGGITGTFGGFMGILGAAGIVFFAFIGFDSVSTMAPDAKHPKRDLPVGVLGSLTICTILYVAFSYMLSGVATVQDLRTIGKEASVTFAITKYMPHYAWLAKLATVAILAGFSSTILVMLWGQSRVCYFMSRDGLVPKMFGAIHPRFKTMHKSHWLFFVLTALFAAFAPEEVVGDLTSIGTLFAFILVCGGVWVLRLRHPDLKRGFRVPALPIVSILGIIICGAIIYGRGWLNWLRLVIWLVVGMIFYFGYGRRHSHVQNSGTAVASPSSLD
jgi:basic amino acid/polyamine antiporter, APA family